MRTLRGAAFAALLCLAACAKTTMTAHDTMHHDFEPLWDYNDPAASEARFRAELARVAAGTEAESQLLTQIARTHGLRRDFAQAHALLDRVEPRVATSSPKIAVRYALERGRTFNSTGGEENKARAHALFVAAWDKASAAGLDFYAIDAAHMMAFVTPPAEQHQWNLKALALTERTPDARAKKWLIALYNNIGWTYHDEKNYPAALDMFEKALIAANARGSPTQQRVAQWAVARCLRSLGRIDEALARQVALRDAPNLGASGDGYVFEEIGENLQLLGRADEARVNFARAYELLKDDAWLQANESARLARLRELGGVR